MTNADQGMKNGVLLPHFMRCAHSALVNLCLVLITPDELGTKRSKKNPSLRRSKGFLNFVLSTGGPGQLSLCFKRND